MIDLFSSFASTDVVDKRDNHTLDNTDIALEIKIAKEDEAMEKPTIQRCFCEHI